MYAHRVFRPLEAERKRHGLTATDLARLCNCDRSYITQYERGHREVSASFKMTASRALGLPVDRVFPQAESGQEGMTL